jgi:hypothetical protein
MQRVAVPLMGGCAGPGPMSAFNTVPAHSFPAAAAGFAEQMTAKLEAKTTLIILFIGYSFYG